jgi:predicted acylesterase/phospholipase RssA
MTPYERSQDRARVWYGPAQVGRWYHGVFEGGGARAIAYPGALEAMVESGAWFRSVTGSSAGAITAAFIGSGAQASRAMEFTVEMFELVDEGRFKGLVRLLRRGGYFAGNELRDWLDAQFANELGRLTHRSVDRPVTFETMFEISGIETFVVATNLSLNQPIVFSHLLTPRCSVAEAVVASSATPVAFESRLLAVPSAGGSGPRKHHTIVDGGLTSNFPTFVLTDAAFRRRYGLEPVRAEEFEILAFRLSQDPTEEIRPSPAIEFRAGPVKVDAYEWSRPQRPVRENGWRRGLAALLAPFAAAARLLDRTGDRHRGRWPAFGSRWTRNLGAAIDGTFGALTPPLVALTLWLVIAGGAVAGIARLLAELAQIDSPAWAVAAWAGAVLVVLPLLVVLLLLLSLGLMLNSLLLRPARATLYGLVMTYVAAGRSRVWEEDSPYVVTLDVPHEVTTVSFAEAVERRQEIAAAARRTTLAHLERTLRSIA